MVVISDNAKYRHARLHKDWRDRYTADFALDYLPPYSPELNPIERVWKLTRRRCLHNRYFAQLDEVIAAVETEFESWARRNDTLRRLCAMTEDAVYSCVAEPGTVNSDHHNIAARLGDEGNYRLMR